MATEVIYQNNAKVQETRMELKESLGLRTASRTELLKSEKTSTAEVKSWLVMLELGCSSV